MIIRHINSEFTLNFSPVNSLLVDIPMVGISTLMKVREMVDN